MPKPIPTLSKPLTNLQKATLSQWAKKGYTRAKELDLTDEKEADWRGRESIAACGRRISEATNGDYLVLLAHFQSLAGDSGKAFASTMRAQNDPKRQALHKLDSELTKAGLDRAYAEAICMSTYKCSIAQASPKQTWQLMYTIRNRRNSTHGQA
ncbi:hypothetical protein [Verrucomicrobium spinosum]|uniref:hypothetical protein n=1 Tax=Verrucomicrobium spinosum TaxID=2736 RepID=UPI00017463EB|nr:hypothetical protein [Verrucomicrobium spinosum]